MDILWYAIAFVVGCIVVAACIGMFACGCWCLHILYKRLGVYFGNNDVGDVVIPVICISIGLSPVLIMLGWVIMEKLGWVTL